MSVFKQKCVFVIHDVEDKLILWEKKIKKKESLVSEVQLKPRLFSKEIIWESNGRSQPSALCHSQSSPRWKPRATSQLTSDSSAPWEIFCGCSKVPPCFPLPSGMIFKQQVPNSNGTQALSFLSHLRTLSTTEMFTCFLYSAKIVFKAQLVAY